MALDVQDRAVEDRRRAFADDRAAPSADAAVDVAATPFERFVAEPTTAERLARERTTAERLAGDPPFAPVTADAAIDGVPVFQTSWPDAAFAAPPAAATDATGTDPDRLDPASLDDDPASLAAGVEDVRTAEAELRALETEIARLGDNDPLIDARVRERDALATRLTEFRSAAAELLPALDGAHERYLATRIATPERITPTLLPGVTGTRTIGISTDTGQPVLPRGAEVSYSLEIPPYIAAESPTVRAFAINDPAAVSRGEVPPVVELGEGGRIDARAAAIGTHQIVYEVRFGDGPPEYYTYAQEVAAPETVAARALDALEGAPPQPSLLAIGLDRRIEMGEEHLAALRADPRADDDEIAFTERALEELREARENIPARLAEDAIAEAVPIRSVLIAGDNGAVVPLQLYARPMENGRWAIVDVTDPSDIRVYEGDEADDPAAGLDSAWDDFIANNDLPGGRIAASRPVVGGGYENERIATALEALPNDDGWHRDSDGRSGFQAWRDNLGIASIALAGLGVVALAAAPFTGGTTAAAAPWLFGAAGVTGAASAGFNVADRVRHGEFEWRDTETALDMIGIVGGFTAVGSSALTIARRGTTTVIAANGARVSVSEVDDFGRWLMLSSQADTVAGGAGAVIVTREYLREIEAVRGDPTLSEAQKEERVAALTREAAAVGGLMVLGVGLGATSLRQAARQAPETIALTNLSAGLDGADIDELIARHGRDAVIWAGQELDGPAARALLDELGPETLGNLRGTAPTEVATLHGAYRSLGLDFDELARTRSFDRLQRIEEIVSDSNPNQRMSIVNAERVLDDFHPPGYELGSVAGSGGAGSDLVFVNAATDATFSIENKSVTGRSSFNKALRHAVQDQDADLVFVQVPAGTDAENWLARFVGSRNAEQLAPYAGTDVVFVDPTGNVLLPRQPIYDPPIPPGAN